MNDQIQVVTDAFEHREVKPHFINPCCFGEDFAAWLAKELAPLTAAGFQLSEPIQEDYGWGLWASRNDSSFWIALSFCDDGPVEEPAEWLVSVSHEGGLLKRLFRKPDAEGFREVRDRVWQSLRSNPAIDIVQ